MEEYVAKDKDKDRDDDLEFEIVELEEDEDNEDDKTGSEDDTPSKEKSLKSDDDVDDSELESVDDPEQDDDEDALSPEERKRYGRRARRRIQKLVSRTKSMELKLAEQNNQIQELSTAKRAESERSRESQEQALEEAENRLKAQEDQLLAALKTAKEATDIDAEVQAQGQLAELKANRLRLGDYKRQLKASPAVDQPPGDSRTADRVATQEPEYTPRTKRWFKANPWFQGDDADERRKTRVAMAVHQELVEEGFNPKDDEDEYFAELDSRLKDSFPDLGKKPVRRQQQSTVSGVTNSASRDSRRAKTQVKLTKDEVAMAKRMGVELKEYARQKLMIQQKQEAI